MSFYKAMAITFAFTLLIAPALAEFKGKQGERATYESLTNGQSAGTAIYGVEGKYRIGNIATQKFQITDSSGGKIEGYLDNNGKPIRVDIFDSSASQATMTTAFDHQKKVATISYEAPALYGNNTTTQKQDMTVNITSNTYDMLFLPQFLRYMPIKEGYRTSFQLFNAPGAVMASSFAPLFMMMGITLDPSALAMADATLRVVGRESIRVGSSTYDCYKVIVNVTMNIPPQLAAIDPSLASQSSEQQMWLRTSDLLMVRSYNEEATAITDPQTNTPRQQKTTYETRLTSLTYA